MKIAIEYIRWLQKERTKINKVPLDEIEFYENGMKVIIDKAKIEEFKLIGLINTDFILSGFYKTQDCVDELIKNQKDMPPEFNKVVDKMLDDEIRICPVCKKSDQHKPWCSAGYGDVNPV